eukprot:scaffold32801_cov31-Tisochrysis_lutea.AAC.2
MVGGWDVCPKRVAVLLAGRLVSGIACGGATVVVPLYLGEVSPAHLRGMLGTMNQLMMVIGMFGAQLLGLPSSLGTMGGWPWMLAAPAVPALMQLLLQPMLLESPRWYAIMGNDLMAEEMLVQVLRGALVSRSTHQPTPTQPARAKPNLLAALAATTAARLPPGRPRGPGGALLHVRSRKARQRDAPQLDLALRLLLSLQLDVILRLVALQSTRP